MEKKLKPDPLVLNVQELYLFPKFVKRPKNRLRFILIALLLVIAVVSFILSSLLMNEDSQALPSHKSGNFSLSNSLVIGDPKNE